MIQPVNTYSTVLIDDEFNVLSSLSMVLEDAGLFHVIGSFSSIAEAYDFFLTSGKKVDFIFCDIQMPGMEGTKGESLLREFTRFYILCTGLAEQKAIDAVRTPHDGFLEKPIIDESIRTLLTRLQLRPQLLEEERYIFVRALLPQPASKKEDITKSKRNKKTDRQVRPLIPVPLDKVVKMEVVGTEVHVFVVEASGEVVVAGATRATLKALYQKYKELELFVYPNSSILIQFKYVIKMDLHSVFFLGNPGVMRTDVAAVTSTGRKRVKKFIDDSKNKFTKEVHAV